MQDEDWGCVPASDLFTSTGKTLSLNYLVEKIGKNEWRNSVSASPTMSSSESSASDNTTEQSNKSSSTTSGQRPVAKKILKKRTTNSVRMPNLKHVTFEVASFVNTHVAPGEDKQKAEELLAMRLGAKPLKPKPVPYKQLKEERQKMAKEAEEGQVDRFELFRRQLLPKKKRSGGAAAGKKRGFKPKRGR